MFINLLFFCLGYYSCIYCNNYSLNITLSSDSSSTILAEEKINSIKTAQDKILQMLAPDMRRASP